MSNTFEQTLLKSIDDYIDHGTSHYEMHQIAHYLNMLPNVTSQIHTKFNSLLSDMDYTKIKKTLDLLEYITVFSPPKVPELVNDDKFMENISQILMETYLQDSALNLLKLWADDYNDSREDMDKVFLLIENLEAFELQLPYSYESPYKAVQTMPAATADNRPEQAVAAGEPFLPPKVRDLVNKAREVVENMKKVLEGQNFDEASREFKKNKLQLLLSQNLSASSDLSDQKTAETSYEVKQRIDVSIKELKSYRVKLQEKLDAVEKGQNKPNQGTQNQNAAPAAADGYKIVVSATDNQQTNISQLSAQTMEVEDLMNYKVQPCQEGAICSHAPAQNQQMPIQTSYYSTMHCPYWHTKDDRRRPVYDQMNRVVYSFGICPSIQDCEKGDSCGFSHNFFEHLYHPLNYKKKECVAKKVCRNAKFCPHYHSIEEKKAWNHIARGYFDAPADTNDNLLEDNQNMQEITHWKNHEQENYNHNSEDDLEDYGYKPAKVADQESNEPYKPSYGAAQNIHGDSSQNWRNTYEKEKEPEGVLHSKLVIRKKYENPGMLNTLFHKSSVFSGLPFYSQYAPPESKQVESQEKGEESEQGKEKQN